MAKFSKNGSFKDLQKFNLIVYGPTDDIFFSFSEILSNQQKFTTRALKGVRQKSLPKIQKNILIALSFLMTAANRLHIDVENILWQRFPFACSYCASCPCICKKTKLRKRKTPLPPRRQKPETLNQFQKMFAQIYPPASRTIDHAAIHLAEEMGELSEAVHLYFAQHRKKQFEAIEYEIADFISCLFGVANSLNFNVSENLSKLFYKNCHICHSAPCNCSFSFIASYKS